MMGSEEGRDNERPVHKVQVKDFKLGKYPVTNAQFALCSAIHMEVLR